MIYIVETSDGDVWHYDNLDEAQRAIYVFGGKITKKDDQECECISADAGK